MSHGLIERRHRRLVVILLILSIAMVGLTFASVPLYRLFCQVTGYGGTPQRAETHAEIVPHSRLITVRFNADIDYRLPWQFKPNRRQMDVHLGETSLMFYHVTNLASRPISGIAVYNVTPPKAGLYFNKLQCFCFDEQRLTAKQEMQMPVTFYIDPALADDPDFADADTITLSYTFYHAVSKDEDN